MFRGYSIELPSYSRSLHDIVDTEDHCIYFLQELELIPKFDDAPPCPVCSGSMGTLEHEIGWMWSCGNKTCPGSVNPLQNTFFEDIPLPLRVVVEIIICHFLRKDDIQMAYNYTRNKYSNYLNIITKEVIEQVYDKCKIVCQIIMSQEHERMIGPYISTLYLMYLKRTINAPSRSWGYKAYTFLMDIKAVYPGYGKIGLNYKHLSTS